MIDVRGPSPQEVLRYIRKQAEKIKGSKSVSSDPSWPLLKSLISDFCLEFLA